jgi:calcineurin-like phosphoesterase family protein
MIFFIGDTHIGHQNILKFEPENRPFETIDEHDQILCNNWNSVIGPDDIVWHLGDVFFGSDERVKTYLQQLNGHKYLVMGNHDRIVPGNKEVLLQFFEKIYGVAYYKDGILSHIPIHPAQLESRFKFNIHGHMHSHNIQDDRYYNVSCEQIGLTPISEVDLFRKKRPL